MTNTPLMPKATAVWLLENTILTFDQIADFCKLHPLEVKGIADGEVAAGIRGQDPINAGQLSREELQHAIQDPHYRMKLSFSKIKLPEQKKGRRSRYTPLSRRHDRPNAILWLVRNHPELKDAQIIRLVGTTKQTLEAVRNRTHWNIAALTPMDPVTLGLCTQIDLDLEITRAGKGLPGGTEEGLAQESGPTLAPVEETTETEIREENYEDVFGTGSASPIPSQREEEYDIESVFAKKNT